MQTLYIPGMAGPPGSLDTLIRECGLTDAECDREMRRAHLEKASRSCCARWRLLPPKLGVGPEAVEKLERAHDGEEERKRAFFLLWKQVKGPAASYKRLAAALLEVGCVEDAEKVCWLLWESISTHTIPPLTTGDSASGTKIQGMFLFMLHAVNMYLTRCSTPPVSFLLTSCSTHLFNHYLSSPSLTPIASHPTPH